MDLTMEMLVTSRTAAECGMLFTSATASPISTNLDNSPMTVSKLSDFATDDTAGTTSPIVSMAAGVEMELDMAALAASLSNSTCLFAVSASVQLTVSVAFLSLVDDSVDRRSWWVGPDELTHINAAPLKRFAITHRRLENLAESIAQLRFRFVPSIWSCGIPEPTRGKTPARPYET